MNPLFVRPISAAAPLRITWNSRTAACGKKNTPSLPPRWFPCKRVVEVGAVDGDVRVDRSLAGDDEAVAIGFLRDGRRQLGELGEIAAADRQIRHRARADGACWWPFRPCRAAAARP